MTTNRWRKVENEFGYPCYTMEGSGVKQFDHPNFSMILQSLDGMDNIKYSVYRTAFKLYKLQNELKVPPFRITTGVFARHKLSLSESSLSLDLDELEAVLADIYFASEKEGLFDGDVDLTVDLIINLLLNVYDKERKEPIKVLSAKIVLIVLSDEPISEKWLALAKCAADHNGCVSPRRLANLLTNIAAIATYFGEDDGVTLQDDVQACFAKSVGMLGVSANAVAEWAINHCSTAKWLSVLSRIQNCRRQGGTNTTCAACNKDILQMLKFKCAKCSDVYFCENCYLYDNNLLSIDGHKKTHIVEEIIDGEPKPNECSKFLTSVRRLFFCKKKRRKNKKTHDKENVKETEQNKPAIFTSTVGKARGIKDASPSGMLQDIINQLENQNRALQDLSDQLKNAGKDDEVLKLKVDTHWNHISTQINRLKVLKENLLQSPQQPPNSDTKDKTERMQAFDLFSPIPMLDEEKQSKVDQKTQPRVLSLDSGNFSVVSKTSNNLMTMSGDALKPVVHTTSDSISNVSMNDISSWYNETENNPDRKTLKSTTKLNCIAETSIPADYSQSLCVTEQRYDADLRSVANSNVKMKELNADLDTVLDRLQQILTNNFAMDDSCFDNTQLRETANEMEGLLGTLIRGVEERVTLNASKCLV